MTKTEFFKKNVYSFVIHFSTLYCAVYMKIDEGRNKNENGWSGRAEWLPRDAEK